MTDRELLEWVAKASGLEVVGPAPKYIAQGCNEWALIVRNDKGGDSVFDPLTDDGDALRLAVKLGISVFRDEDVVWTNGKCLVSMKETVADPYAATRRAIVRAAAEIGKAMK